MVSGGAPFEGPTPQAVIAQHISDAAPHLRTSDPTIPLFVERAVERAMAKDPADRFASASDFAAALTSGITVPRVRTRAMRRGAAVGLAGAVLVALVVWGLTALLAGARIERLAVLPLTDLTGDPEQVYLAAGVHEALIAELGQLGLSVTARATMVQYRDTDKTISEIARELDADAVIEGSVFRGGDSLEITARLYDAEEQEIWNGTFDGVLSNVVALYRGFARAIAGQIQLSLRPSDEARLGETRAVNPAVYEAYLRGMHVLHNATTPEQYDSAVAYFQQAVEQNPADAPAWAGLAYYYVTLRHSIGLGDEGLWANARAAAERAIRLDSNSAEGWAALGCQTYFDRDWETAEQAYRKANELNPSLAWNHYHYSWLLALFGRVEEAVAEHERAKALDPLTPCAGPLETPQLDRRVASRSVTGSTGPNHKRHIQRVEHHRVHSTLADAQRNVGGWMESELHRAVVATLPVEHVELWVGIFRTDPPNPQQPLIIDRQAGNHWLGFGH
jgi:TolB-like protein